VWIALIGLVALVVALAQPLMVVFGGMVFGALLDGAAAAAGAAHPAHPARCDRAVGGGLGLWFVTYAGSQIAEQAAALPATCRPRR
jgi:glucose-6-phosphate isomerase